ncbi:FadR/GntR family transcriptional regulator [Sphingomonas chungangi]|nr:FCD domain-containing protein [Sphingomonas chungangi]
MDMAMDGAARRADGGSLVQRAMDAVKDHIRDQRLRVGDTLPGEAHFAGELGVSRAVMREAFGALGALKLIDVGNGRKARVGALDGSVMAAALGHGITTAQISVADVWDVRRTIEMRTVVLAAKNRTGDEAARIVALAEAMAADADDLVAKTRHDIAFHEAIAIASRNTLFVQIVASFGPLMEVAVPAAWGTRTTEEQRVSTIARHRAVARAIADGDAVAAVAAMSDHFDASIDDILKASR